MNREEKIERGKDRKGNWKPEGKKALAKSIIAIPQFVVAVLMYVDSVMYVAPLR